jgi:hypothetical protein
MHSPALADALYNTITGKLSAGGSTVYTAWIGYVMICSWWKQWCSHSVHPETGHRGAAVDHEETQEAGFSVSRATFLLEGQSRACELSA